jgi:FKBP-type peptidyl-prolyl cis-trans isomerase 2
MAPGTLLPYMPIARGDTVTIEYVGRLQDGSVFDTSRADIAESTDLDHHPDRDHDPLTVEIGAGRIIEGLEDGLVGLEVGDETTIVVDPDDGYGDHTEDRVVSYDREEFTAMVDGHDIAEGLEVQTEQGLSGRVVELREDVVRVDFNHELAGERLEFAVEVLEVE